MVARLAVAAATYHIDKPYTYKVPEVLADKLTPGMRVSIPFGRGNRRSEGLVLSTSFEKLPISGESKKKDLKFINTSLDEKPVLSQEQLKLALWMSDRFFCTVYSAAKAMLPAGMWFKDGVKRLGDKTVTTAILDIPAEEASLFAAQKKQRAPQQSNILELLSQIGSASVKELCYFTGASRSSVKALADLGVIVLKETEVFRRPSIKTIQADGPILLNAEQQDVFNDLSERLDSGSAGAALLYGVTGSGKTSIYIKLIEKVLVKGRDALVLVPEIALTPQLISTFASYFGDNIAVLHSALGIGERYDEWKRIRAGNVHVVVGTRSAVFAPVSNLGLLIIDEEQEHTYKSENSPRYHARDVAKFRCVSSGALLVLGSATPSVESMYSAGEGRYSLYRLENRYNEMELPPVIIADMKKELKNGNGGTISSILLGEIRANLERGEQSILFINRRGASTLIACGECGYTFTCPRCSVSVTYHSVNRRLMCHYCGYSEVERDSCPDCGGKLKFIGAGTQKVESELGELLPGTGIIRMDADTVSMSNTHEEHLTRFREKKIPILLGTQMVAKGLDFENVTLVGVLSADQMLYINDYRAHERTFSLITQVVGRSGRGSKQGRAVIQTLTPSNEVIRLAAGQDYDSFYIREIALRRLTGSPPIFDLVALTVSGQDETLVLQSCVKLRQALQGYFRDLDEIKILGPAPAAVAKINNRYRYRLSISCKINRRIRDTIAHVVREAAKNREFRGIHVFADVDPYES
ncbi:MAG: primosomal protein N' [Clostridiales bacterium]|nr:primosomal protein N' [Clostridiales bacterium]